MWALIQIPIMNTFWKVQNHDFLGLGALWLHDSYFVWVKPYATRTKAKNESLGWGLGRRTTKAMGREFYTFPHKILSPVNAMFTHEGF